MSYVSLAIFDDLRYSSRSIRINLLRFGVLLTFLVLSSACMSVRPVVTRHHDDMVVVRVETDLRNTNRLHRWTTKVLREICSEFYQHYQDVFDILLIVSNLSEPGESETEPQTRPERSGIWYSGAMFKISNSTRGIGMKTVDRSSSVGGSSKLKGVMHLPKRTYLMRGPSLHELMHLWVGDDVIPSTFQNHSGFSSVYGQLGGFEQQKLIELGDGRYAAGRWGTYANHGNSLPYAPLELYLAGWIAADEVPGILIAEDGEWVVENGVQQVSPEGHSMFSASGWS